MIRKLCAVISLLLIILLTGCGNNSNTKEKSINSSPVAENNVSEDTKKTIFRNVTFGMTLEEVKRSEASELTKETNSILGYKTVIATYECNLGYYFNNKNELYGIKFGINKVFEDKDSYTVAYNKIKQALIEKYGELEFADKVYADVIIGSGWNKENFNVMIMVKPIEKMHMVLVEISSKVIKPQNDSNGL